MYCLVFELKYAGQTVEITSSTIALEEQEQKGNAILIKEDSKTGAKPQSSRNQTTNKKIKTTSKRCKK